MVAQFNSTSNDLKAQLISGLKRLPSDWALTPVLGNKNPYREDWNRAVPMSRRQLIVAIEDGDTGVGKDREYCLIYPQGYGLRTGKWSNGILAVDADGEAAHGLLNQLGGLPKTVSFTSGKLGRCQYLVRVPEEYWSVISTKKINTGVKGADGKDQLLELRWNGCQSVLPPSVHPETGSYKWVNSPQDCEVAQCPTWVIEYFLNESTTATTNSTTTNLLTDDVPLYQCLTKDDRDLIDHGVGEGSRDDNGAKLARNLIGTAARLTHLGYRFVDNGRQLFDDYCARCSPPLSAKDAERIWKSAAKSNPSATLSDDALDNCIKAWQRNQITRPQQGATAPKPSNVIPHPTMTKQLMSDSDIDFIKKEYQKLLEVGADDALIEAFKIRVRQQFSILQPSELNKLLSAIAKEFQKQLDLTDEAEELAKLVDATDQTINLADYLPARLALPLAQYCQWQNLRHAVVFTSFITAISSLHKVGTELILQRSVGFKVPPTLFGAIVAESGSKKSPIFRATAREPLNVLKKDDAREYELELKEYNKELQQWSEAEQGSKGDRPQEPPKPPLYYFSDATGEGIKAQAASAPDKALFALVDELAGFFNASNQYRGGRGSDKQDLLSYFDGTGATVLRSGGVKVDVMQIYLSILGTIQPEILRQAMGNTNDFDGSWARFLIAIQPNTPSQLPDENHVGVDMKDLLATYFRAIHNLPKTEYRLSKDAFKFYQSWYNRLEQLRVSHPSSGMRAVYSKAEGLTGRLALNLHVLHELASDRTPSIEIPLARIKEAINLMKFYIGQVKMIHATVDDSTHAPQIFKVIELSKRKQLAGEEGWIKARDIISNSSKKNRLTSSEARELMMGATNSGYGEIKGSGIRLEFKAFTKNAGQVLAIAGDCWSNAGQPEMPETIANTLSQEIAGFAGHERAFFEELVEDKNQNDPDGQNQPEPIPEEPPQPLIEGIVSQHDQQTVESVDIQVLESAGSPTSNDQQIDQHDQQIEKHDQQIDHTTSKFKPSDKVAAADPYELKHAWVGEVVSVDGETVLVYWPQREGSSVNPTEEHVASYLRLLE
jgi:hypothetical protein